MKLILSLLMNMFFGWLSLYSLLNPEQVGYAKDHNGNSVQPYTFIFQLTGIMLAIMLWLVSVLLIYHYAKKIGSNKEFTQ